MIDGDEQRFLSHLGGTVRIMKHNIEPAGEIRRFIEQFGLASSPYFEGPQAECPICSGAINQLALTLDLTGYDELACGDCGAVLAA